MKKTIVIGKERQQIWFDLECKQSRQVVRQYLRNYHNGNSDTDRASYTQKRNEYKELPRQKKAQHRRSVLYKKVAATLKHSGKPGSLLDQKRQ